MGWANSGFLYCLGFRAIRGCIYKHCSAPKLVVNHISHIIVQDPGLVVPPDVANQLVNWVNNSLVFYCFDLLFFICCVRLLGYSCGLLSTGIRTDFPTTGTRALVLRSEGL